MQKNQAILMQKNHIFFRYIKKKRIFTS